MSYKILIVLFYLATLGLVSFLGVTLQRDWCRYFIEFKRRRRKRRRRRKKSTEKPARSPRPFFLFWWLKTSGRALAAACSVYLLLTAGFYLAWPLLRYGGTSGHAAAAIPVKTAQQKEQWKSYVELCLVAENKPQDPFLQLKLARAQRDLGLAHKTLATYHRVIYLDTLSLDAQYELGCLAVGMGETNLAISQVVALTRNWPTRPEPHLLQARIDIRAGKPVEGLTQVRRALAAEPGDREVRLLLIEMLLQQHAYAEVPRLVQEGLKQPPSQLTQTVNSSQWVTLSTGGAPPVTTTTLLYLLARSQVGLGQFAAADATLQAAATTDPSSSESYMALGDLRMSCSKYRSALAAYEEVLKRNPESTMAMNNIASLSVEHGFDLARAATLAARMYTKYPQEPAVADTLGWVLFSQQGKLEQALPLLQFAATGAPKNPLHRYHYGAALLKDGQVESGRNELTAALKLSGESDGAVKARLLLGGKG